MKYNEKNIWDYINGEEIDNIDEYENDYKFMMKVINITNDKKMYYLCSNHVKENYEFIKFIVYKFKKDKEFIHNIASDFLDKQDESDLNYKELVFIMSDIFNDRDNDKDIIYNLKRSIIYSNEIMAINALISDEFNDCLKKNIGKGFIFVLLSDLGKSEIIKNYFATRFLDEIFYERENINLEELIHTRFSNVNILKKIGIKNFIINYVKDYDIALSDYLFAHIDLINKLEKDISKIINRWENYTNELLERKNNIFFQEVNNLISLYDAFFDYIDVCNYIDNSNINLPVKLNHFAELDNLNYIDINKISLSEYKCLQEIIKLAKDLYVNQIIDKEYNYNKNDTKKKNSSRVLTFKSKFN